MKYIVAAQRYAVVCFYGNMLEYAANAHLKI